MKKFFLYFASLMAVAFSSCNKEDGVGLSVQPDEDMMFTHSGKVYVSTATEKCDSVLAKSDYLYLGQYSDEKFGISRAEFMTQVDGRVGALDLPDTSLATTTGGISRSILTLLDDRFGNITAIKNGRDVRVDSVVFYIQYSSSFVGDSTSLQSVKLYELNKTLPNSNAVYSNVNVADYCDKSVLLGTATYRVVGNKVIRIKLDDAYAQKVMDVCLNKTVASQEEFCEMFKGYYVSHSFNEGAIITCTSVGLQVYYSFDGEIYTTFDGRDTVVSGRSFTYNGENINPLISSFLLTSNKGVNQVNMFSHPDLDEKLVELIKKPFTYIYTPSGLNTTVSIPFDEIKGQLEKEVGAGSLSNLMFNSARLRLQASKLNWRTYLGKNPNSYLMLIKRDKIVDFFYHNSTPDGMDSFVAAYDSQTDTYSFDLSLALQQKLKGNNDILENLVIVPVYVKSVSSSNGKSTSYYKQLLSTSALNLYSSSASEPELQPYLDFVYTRRQ